MVRKTTFTKIKCRIKMLLEAMPLRDKAQVQELKRKAIKLRDSTDKNLLRLRKQRLKKLSIFLIQMDLA